MSSYNRTVITGREFNELNSELLIMLIEDTNGYTNPKGYEFYFISAMQYFIKPEHKYYMFIRINETSAVNCVLNDKNRRMYCSTYISGEIREIFPKVNLHIRHQYEVDANLVAFDVHIALAKKDYELYKQYLIKFNSDSFYDAILGPGANPRNIMFVPSNVKHRHCEDMLVRNPTATAARCLHTQVKTRDFYVKVLRRVMNSNNSANKFLARSLYEEARHKYKIKIDEITTKKEDQAYFTYVI